MTPDRIDRKDVYEGIELDGTALTIHGYEETDEYKDGSELAYFHVTKATFGYDIFGHTYYAECPEEFLKVLNDLDQDYYKQIIDQIKGE